MPGAYHNEHPNAGTTDLHNNVCQALEEGYVARDHCGKSHRRVEVAPRHISRDVNCITALQLSTYTGVCLSCSRVGPGLTQDS